MSRVLAILMLAAAITSEVVAAEWPIQFQCTGLESYDIRGTHNVDWAWGNIRSKDGSVVFGFSVGPMVEELVPAERPAGFRTFRTVHFKDVVLRYGLNVRRKQVQATLVGAPMHRRVNLVGRPEHEKQLVAFAQLLSTSPCTAKIDRTVVTAPPN